MPGEKVTQTLDIVTPSSDVATNETFALEASGLTPENTESLTFLWKVTESPQGSGAEILQTGSALTTFKPDLPGQYLFSLTAYQGNEVLDTATATVTAKNPRIEQLGPVRATKHPSMYSYIGDIVLAEESAVALAGNTTTLYTYLVFNPRTWEIIKEGRNEEFFLNHGSELAFDGENVWATSYGWSNGVPQTFVFKVDDSGIVIDKIDCPASNTGGFCEGLAWDGENFWSGSDDNTDITCFDRTGEIVRVIENAWATVGRKQDLYYNQKTGRVVALKGTEALLIDPETGMVLSSSNVQNLRNGDWDGSEWIQANNSTQEIEVFSVIETLP